MNKKKALKEIRDLVSSIVSNQGDAMIITSGKDGNPHGAWMGTLANTKLSKIITMTSPDSRKVMNVLHNPKVEWIYTDKNHETVVYFRGVARVIYELDEINKAWKELKDKERAYFMKYASGGMSFLIIETNVSEIEYVVPEKNVYKTIKPPFY